MRKRKQEAVARGVLRVALGAGALVLAGSAWAAGGHHSVDDAGILAPGECEVESWFSRGGGVRMLHAGANCRVGPVELGVAAEHARQSGTPSQTGWGLEAKWATDVVPDVFSVGVSLSPGWAAHARPRYQGFTLNGLASWKPADGWMVHANLGRDFVHRASDENRWGVSAEWEPVDHWSVLGERYRESGAHFVRAGLRWTGAKGWNVDLSRAHRLQGPGASAWTLGVGYVFDR